MTVDPGTALICSAKGCRAPAVHQLRWNNPKLHEPNARKTWLACAAHRERLGDFLAVRGFLREVLPVPPPAGNGTHDATRNGTPDDTDNAADDAADDAAAQDPPPAAGGMGAMTP